MSSKTIKDLPIYGDSSSQSTKPIWIVIEKQEKSELEKFVTNVRQQACSLMREFNDQRNATVNYYEQSKNTLKTQIDFIRSETNILPKVAFISLSGLSGLLIGYKKSAFRKFLYSSLLTTGSAALCYPKEAKIYSNQIYEAGSKGAMDIYRTYIWPEEKKKSKSPTVNETKIVDSKDTIVKLDNQTIKSTKQTRTIVGDQGQSSEEDKDMYTTRK